LLLGLILSWSQTFFFFFFLFFSARGNKKKCFVWGGEGGIGGGGGVGSGGGSSEKYFLVFTFVEMGLPLTKVYCDFISFPFYILLLVLGFLVLSLFSFPNCLGQRLQWPGSLWEED